eukprot:SAG31_NODE_49_length_30599_cov_15.615016_8_plen_214_part_00
MRWPRSLRSPQRQCCRRSLFRRIDLFFRKRDRLIVKVCPTVLIATAVVNLDVMMLHRSGSRGRGPHEVRGSVLGAGFAPEPPACFHLPVFSNRPGAHRSAALVHMCCSRLKRMCLGTHVELRAWFWTRARPSSRSAWHGVPLEGGECHQDCAGVRLLEEVGSGESLIRAQAKARDVIHELFDVLNLRKQTVTVGHDIAERRQRTGAPRARVSD